MIASTSLTGDLILARQSAHPSRSYSAGSTCHVAWPTSASSALGQTHRATPFPPVDAVDHRHQLLGTWARVRMNRSAVTSPRRLRSISRMEHFENGFRLSKYATGCGASSTTSRRTSIANDVSESDTSSAELDFNSPSPNRISQLLTMSHVLFMPQIVGTNQLIEFRTNSGSDQRPTLFKS